MVSLVCPRVRACTSTSPPTLTSLVSTEPSMLRVSSFPCLCRSLLIAVCIYFLIDFFCSVFSLSLTLTLTPSLCLSHSLCLSRFLSTSVSLSVARWLKGPCASGLFGLLALLDVTRGSLEYVAAIFFLAARATFNPVMRPSGDFGGLSFPWGRNGHELPSYSVD